jgi:hypothetical protein
MDAVTGQIVGAGVGRIPVHKVKPSRPTTLKKKALKKDACSTERWGRQRKR